MVDCIRTLSKFFRGIIVEDRKTIIFNIITAGVLYGLEDCADLDKVLMAYQAFRLGAGDLATLYNMAQKENGIQVLQDFINVMKAHHQNNA